MKVAIYGKDFHEHYYQPVLRTLELLRQAGFELVIHEELGSFLTDKVGFGDHFSTFNEEDHSKLPGSRCMISIGGDGTLLNTVYYAVPHDIPVMGLNTGRLGFISSISIEEVEETVEHLKNDSLIEEHRSLLRLHLDSGEFSNHRLALNEIAVHKQDTSSMITIHTFIDDVFVNSYWADGLIICTPTGSTAYSLACGGPIVMPGSENFVITPIAPHNLTVRPLVVDNESTIRLKVEGRSDHCMISKDSESTSLHIGCELMMRKADKQMKLLRPPTKDFLHTIRNKLSWGVDKRN